MADTRMTLLDYAKSQDPDGSQAQVIELMNQYNPWVQDATATPANAPLGNRTTLRRSLPVVGTAKINKGVTRSKSTSDQRTDTIGYFAGRSEMDVRLRMLEGSAAYLKKRSDETAAFEEALAQAVSLTMAYGNIVSDEASFDGLAPRMAALNPGTDLTASQVWSMGSVTGGDGCSIYIVDWAANMTSLIFPPNSVAGLQVNDKPDLPVNDVDGNSFQADVMTYDWFVGLCVKDPRHVARLANIDLSDAIIDSPTQGIILDKLEQIFSRMPDPGPAQRVMYCPIALWSGFTKQARTRANLALQIIDYLGKPTPAMWGYPLRKVQQLATNEATVS